MLGVLSTLLKTDLEIPEQIGKLLSIYLLMAIGFKGGVALSTSELDFDVFSGLMVAVALSVIVPLYVFVIMRRTLGIADAAAVAATYGSISAVTFVTATSYLDANEIEWSGYLVAAMAIMESPAIILGLVLYRMASQQKEMHQTSILRESFLNSSVFLILGSLVVGWISGPAGKAQVSLFVDGLFVGILCLFLLDMGIVAARRFRDIRVMARGSAVKLIGWALVIPLLNAVLALVAVWIVGVDLGDAILLTVLAASASYIAVPAAMRLALPEANPSFYLTMSLAVTFPFNLLIGIPLYHQLLLRLL